MIDIVLTLAFILLPMATWWWSRSATYTAVALVLGFGIAGNVVQSTIAWGAAWNVRGLQLLALGVMLAVLVGARLIRSRTSAAPLARQVLAIGVPLAVFGSLLIAMRVLAPEDPGALTGLGYLMNHPMGEDNAKFLHLAAQLTDGRTISFNGYAAGPLLLIMSVVSSAVTVLSMVMLGGVNQVAVVLNTLIGTQHLFLILVPFALAPLADLLRTRTAAARTPEVPVPFLWLGAIVLFLSNAVLTEYGHLSLQFVLIILVLWALAFLAFMPWWVALSMTLAIATSASVWLPLNVLGLALGAVAVLWCLTQRKWWGLLLSVITLAASADALLSSILFFLGISFGPTAAPTGDEGGAASRVPSLFEIGGGTERVSAMLGLLALVAFVGAALRLSRGAPPRSLWVAFLPIVIFSGYVGMITISDVLSSGSAPNYGSVKITFALAIMVLVACLPLALTLLDAHASRMTTLRWLVSLGVLVLLTMDAFLPRALNAISPKRWGGIDESAPIFWAAAEVRPTADQPLSSLPVACVIAPPVSEQPTALPWGQEAYACTRLLVGMNGIEGQTGYLVEWLGTEWGQQRSIWNESYERLRESTLEFASRPVIKIGRDAELVGLTTFAELLDKNPPVPASTP